MSIEVKDIINKQVIEVIEENEIINILITNVDSEEVITVENASYDVARVTSAVGEANQVKSDTLGIYNDTVVIKNETQAIKDATDLVKTDVEGLKTDVEGLYADTVLAKEAAETASDLAVTTVGNAISGIISHTEDKKVELDAYTTTKEGELDSYILLTSKPDLDNYVLTTLKPDLDTYRTGTVQPALDTYRTGTVQPALDTYRTGTVQPAIDAYVTGKEGEIDTYVSNKITTDINPEIAKAAKWANEDEDVVVESGEYSAKHYSKKAESTATAIASSLTTITENSENIEKIQKIVPDIDKITLVNKLFSGDFEAAVGSDISFNTGTFTYDTSTSKSGDRSLKIVTPSDATGRMNTNFVRQNGDIIYTSAWIKAVDGLSSFSYFGVGTIAPSNEWVRYSNWFNAVADTRSLNWIHTLNGGDALYIDCVFSLNLTEIFGSGNEPSKVEVDDWFDYYLPDFFITHTFEDLNLYNNKVLGGKDGSFNMYGLNELMPFKLTNDIHVSQWDTRQTTVGSSNSNQIRLPITSGASTQKFHINWGDNTAIEYITDGADAIHTYEEEGIYEIQIFGKVNGFRFNDDGDKEKIINIRSFGKDFIIPLAQGVFNGCRNLRITAADFWGNDETLECRNMFRNCVALNKLPNSFFFLEHGDDISYMFLGAESFNQDLSKWNVSKIKNFTFLFHTCRSFNGDISNWDMSSATNLGSMFQSASGFDQDISNWDTSNVTSLGNVFRSATFNRPLNWDTTKVTNCSGLFRVNQSFNQDVSWKPATTTNTWSGDTEYNRLYQVLGTDGKVYRAKVKHTSAAATEPITGADWATVWELDGGKWNLSSCVTFTDMFHTSSVMSVANYDKFLIGLKAQDDAGWTIATNRTLTNNSLKYGADPNAITARNWLTTPVVDGGKGWIITDGGLA